MSKKSPARKTSRRKSHVPPLALQLAALATARDIAYGIDDADAAALRFMKDVAGAPIDKDPDIQNAVDDLAEQHFGARDLARSAEQHVKDGKRIEDCFYEAMTGYRDAAVLLGLCLGYRMAGGAR